MASNPFVLLSVVLFVLPASVASNNGPSLFAWQRQLWFDNKQAILMTTNNEFPGTSDLGVYARSGNTPRVPGNAEGFQAPMEFFWGTPNGAGEAMLSGDQTIQGYTVQDLGNDQTLMGFTLAPLSQVVFRVRELDGRWVGVFLKNGEPVVIFYSWASVAHTQWGNIPTGVNFIDFHGFKVKDCQIDYDEEIVLRAHEGDQWELQRGMADPLAECSAAASNVVLTDSSADGQFNISRQWLVGGTIMVAGLLGGLVVVSMVWKRKVIKEDAPSEKKQQELAEITV